MLDDGLYLEHLILRDLGLGITLEEMRGRMSAAEYAEHSAFYKRQNAERQIRGRGR